MNGEQLKKEFFDFCTKQESCKTCKYSIDECKLLFAYEKGLVDNVLNFLRGNNEK